MDTNNNQQLQETVDMIMGVVRSQISALHSRATRIENKIIEHDRINTALARRIEEMRIDLTDRFNDGFKTLHKQIGESVILPPGHRLERLHSDDDAGYAHSDEEEFGALMSRINQNVGTEEPIPNLTHNESDPHFVPVQDRIAQLEHLMGMASALIRDARDGNGSKHVAGWMKASSYWCEEWRDYYNRHIVNEAQVEG